MNKLLIIGASGHGKVVADIAVRNGYSDITFLDDDENKKYCGEYPVIGKTQDIEHLDGDVFVAIGNCSIRKQIMKKCSDRTFPILIHDNAVVADNAQVGDGTVIMAGAVVNPYAVIGKGCIINTCSSVDHDCVISNYVHVAVGAHICGTVNVGECTWIGAGATVSNNVNICDSSFIGAGAVVVKDIDMSGTYIGVPAQKKIES